MRKLAVSDVNVRRSYSFGILLVIAFIVATGPVLAAEFFCSSGNVTCLIAKINNANGMPGQHTINLEPGSYTLQTVDNGQGNSANGLPVISGSIRIEATADDLPTVIERDLNAPQFR